MNSSENRVGSWLTRQGCHWIFVEQSPFSVADGAKRAKPQQQIHRPDFIAMMDGFGTIAIDVKEYQLQVTKAKLDVIDENGNDDTVELPITWVMMAWEDVCGLFEFQRVSNIPAWFCIVDSKQRDRFSAWFRVDSIYNSFSRIFISESLGIYHSDNRAVLGYFNDWQSVNLSLNDEIGDSRPTFQILVEDPEHVDIIGLTENGAMIYVPPALIDLKAYSSLRDLINIWPAEEELADKATDKQMAFAMTIARSLEISLPVLHDRKTISGFITANVPAFRKIPTSNYR